MTTRWRWRLSEKVRVNITSFWQPHPTKPKIAAPPSGQFFLTMHFCLIDTKSHFIFRRFRENCIILPSIFRELLHFLNIQFIQNIFDTIKHLTTSDKEISVSLEERLIAKTLILYNTASNESSTLINHVGGRRHFLLRWKRVYILFLLHVFSLMSTICKFIHFSP